jgi:hypothetical protein
MELSNELAVDGNAVAGTLSEIFTFDVTSVRVKCSDCGTTNPLAQEVAYVRGPGTVLRCADCSSVVGRFVKTRDSVWLDLTGSASWRIGTAQ